MACESPSELPIEEQILCDVQSQLQEERDAMDVINESDFFGIINVAEVIHFVENCSWWEIGGLAMCQRYRDE